MSRVSGKDDLDGTLLRNLEKRGGEKTLVGWMKVGVRLVEKQQARVVHRGIGNKLDCLQRACSDQLQGNLVAIDFNENLDVCVHVFIEVAGYLQIRKHLANN